MSYNKNHVIDWLIYLPHCHIKKEGPKFLSRKALKDAMWLLVLKSGSLRYERLAQRDKIDLFLFYHLFNEFKAS